MPGIEQGNWRGFDAAAEDSFHFAIDRSPASAGILTEGGDSLPADRLIEAMAQLADIRALLEGSGAGDLADAVPQAQLDVLLPAIKAAIELSFEPIENHAGRAG